MSLDLILQGQVEWARVQGKAVDRGCLETVEANLFQPLKPETFEEFKKGSGDELGLTSTAKRAKMRSLRSSSIVAANVFDYWRGRDLSPLQRALKIEGACTELRFEQKFKHGLRGMRPNIDVVLYRRVGPPVGIECKFCEPYDTNKKGHGPLDPKYFPEGRQRWAKLALPKCQAAAEALGRRLKFQHLNAGQLLKHLLGLAYSYPGTPPSLVYLWYDAGTPEAKAHADEVQRFAGVIEGDAWFNSVTYQALFESIKQAAEPKYVNYLDTRYFLMRRE